MEFKPEKVQEFLHNFKENEDKIRSSEGCSFLQLLRNKDNGSIFFTLSHWKNEESLNNYRQSELFQGVWTKTKAMFSERAEAWSTEIIESGVSHKIK